MSILKIIYIFVKENNLIMKEKIIIGNYTPTTTSKEVIENHLLNNMGVNKNIIEIGDKKYEEREQRKPSHAELMLKTMVSMYETPYERTRPNVDIVEEYKLTLGKESSLCRSDRDWVVRQFNKNYKLIEE